MRAAGEARIEMRGGEAAFDSSPYVRTLALWGLGYLITVLVAAFLRSVGQDTASYGPIEQIFRSPSHTPV